jgi:cell wall-associated NlpC family hydrolase
VRARRVLQLLAATAVVVFALSAGVVVLLFMGSQGGDRSRSGDTSASPCVVSLTGLGSVPGLDAVQLGNARTIITVGRTLGVPRQAMVIAVATALQESSLRNLDHGDLDSVGLFQQRPASGWGSAAELTDPQTASRKFYAALLQVPGWEALPMTLAAQRVQRSAFPLAYARWEALATALVGTALGTSSLDCTSSIGYSTPPGAIGDMLRIALGQQGKPYVWGATGPDSFDCSGLVVYAWRMAGYRSTVRTSQQMYAESERIPLGSEQPGDLLFTHFEADGPGHVLIVVRPGLAVQAPRTGDVVKLTPYSRSGAWVVGRLRTDVLRPLSA